MQNELMRPYGHGNVALAKLSQSRDSQPQQHVQHMRVNDRVSLAAEAELSFQVDGYVAIES